jgi:hypothetical protein
MAKRSKKRKIGGKTGAEPKRRSKRYSPAEIFMAVLGAALIIMFGVIIVLLVFG